MSGRKCLAGILCGGFAAAVLAVGPVSASWIRIDDFEGYNLGPIDGQGSWVANPTYVVASSPAPAAGQSLRTGTPDFDRAYTPVSIPQGSQATLFYRYYKDPFQLDGEAPGHGESQHGLSHLAAPGGASFNDFKVQIDGGGLDRDAGTFRFRLNDGGTFRNLSLSGSEESETRFALNTWYNMWVYVDNTASTYEVFIATGDPLTATPTQLVFWDGTTEKTAFTYRGGAFDGDLQTMLVRRGDYYLDDIYLSAGRNLTPIPEPASIAVLGLGGLALLRRRARA